VEALVALGRFAHGAAPDRLASADQVPWSMQRSTPAHSVRCAARRMDEISGGEKARAHLARALAATCAALAAR
jgi:iron complex transport system ATP-binding protein